MGLYRSHLGIPRLGSGRLLPMPQVPPIKLHRAPRRLTARRSESGQALVEFAMVLLPIVLVVVGIIQFGLLFNANVTLTNAAREAARSGSIYLYVGTDPITNDRDRCTVIVQATKASMGLLSTSPPRFNAAEPCSAAAHRVTADRWVNGDVTIEYCRPVTTSPPAAGECAAAHTVVVNNQRRGYRMTVTVTYRSDIIVPIIGGILGTDAAGRFEQRSSATMVVN
jgi:Flp pilus assembly protein TadG